MSQDSSPSIQSEIDLSTRESPGGLAPILFLIILTPMVEFLTRSTNFSELLSNPLYAIMFFLVTIPGYAIPVLLIREAVVTWKKGLSSLVILGIAYGAVNEGLLAKTYFTFFPLSPNLGQQGRWLGINWPWVTEISLFHMIVSMLVPIALSFLVFPGTMSTRFFTDKETKRLLAALVALLIPLNILEYIALAPGFKGHAPLLVLPIAIILACIYIAYRLPVADTKKELQGFFAKPLVLAVVSLVIFIATFTPILLFFPPFQIIYAIIAQSLGRFTIFAILRIIYPLIIAALVFRFFEKYALSKIQLWAIIVGALVVPVLSALVFPTFSQGAPFAALIYIAAVSLAYRRISRVKTETILN